VCVYRVHNYVPDHDRSKATSDLRGFVRVYSIVLRLVMIGQSSVRFPELFWTANRRAMRRPHRDALDVIGRSATRSIDRSTRARSSVIVAFRVRRGGRRRARARVVIA